MSISSLIENYPELWNRLQSGRERILHSYSASGSNLYSGSRSGVSDPTANRVMKLLKLDEFNQVIVLTGRWIDTELEPEDRPLLINLWRGGAVPRTRMQRMEVSLRQYLRHSAGRVRDAPGLVYANGQSKG